MDSKLDDILNSINDIKTTQTKLINAANEQSKTSKTFTKKLDDLILKFDSLESKFSKLEADNTHLKSRVDSLEHDYDFNKQKYNSPAFEIELLNELYDRQSRANSVIIFNLPKHSFENPTNLSDMSLLKDIINDIGLNIQIIKAHRLGKSISNRPRPLKVSLPNSSDNFLVLRSQNKLHGSHKWPDIRFSSDRSAKQCEFMSNLREELRKRRDKGEKDLIIKYIRGIPNIVLSKN